MHFSVFLIFFYHWFLFCIIYIAMSWNALVSSSSVTSVLLVLSSVSFTSHFIVFISKNFFIKNIFPSLLHFFNTWNTTIIIPLIPLLTLTCILDLIQFMFFSLLRIIFSCFLANHLWLSNFINVLFMLQQGDLCISLNSLELCSRCTYSMGNSMII